MSQALRNRLVKLEQQAAARRVVMFCGTDWRRLPESERAALERDATIELLVIETNVEREGELCRLP
jgi:hypothetical protein